MVCSFLEWAFLFAESRWREGAVVPPAGGATAY